MAGSKKIPGPFCPQEAGNVRKDYPSLRCLDPSNRRNPLVAATVATAANFSQTSTLKVLH